MKAKSRLKVKRDDTPEKNLSDDSQNLESGSNDKPDDHYSELRINEDSLKQFSKDFMETDSETMAKIDVSVRFSIPPDKIKQPTKRVCVLRKTTENIPVVPSSSLLEQTNLRFDPQNRPVQHSILGSVEDFFKMSLSKKRISLNDIPEEYQSKIGLLPPRRPISAMLPFNLKESGKENRKLNKFQTNFNSVKVSQDTSALKHWENRMFERRKVQDHISKKAERAPEKLVFNSGDNYRKNQEISHIISKTISYYGYGHGFRTGSEFWKQREVVGIENIDTIEMTNTLTEKGNAPPILHVGVPDAIRNEKGMPLNDLKLKKLDSEYFKQRVQQLNKVLSDIDSHQPEFNNLMINGMSIARMQENTMLTIGNNQDFNSEESVLQDTKDFMKREDYESVFNIDQHPCLRINDIKLDTASDECNVRILFNGYAKEKCVKVLNFKNAGSSIIRMWWTKLETYDPFNLDNKDVHRFYFKTNDKILLPNETLDFPIIFKSEKFGIFTENWKLETIPVLLSDRPITVCLKGVAIYRDSLAETKKNIENHLRYQSTDKVCRSIIYELIQNVDYKFVVQTVHDEEEDEEGSFGRINKEIPYDIDVVQSIKQLNSSLAPKAEQDNVLWNMDCRELRQKIMSTESLKLDKKEETIQKFYRYTDKLMIPTGKVAISHRDELYKIGYRRLLEFAGDMFDCLKNLRKYHDLPEMDLRISRNKGRSNVSRQRTNVSQVSKTSVKKQSSAGTSKSKQKETSNLARETTESLLYDIDDSGKPLQYSDIDEVAENEQEVTETSNADSNLTIYHYKSYQLIHGMLDECIAEIIKYWQAT